MKKLIICMFIFTASLIAHKQHTHQYIIREGYNLLKLQVGAIPTIESHISVAEGGGGGTWKSGLITAGAWNEDEEDIVYHYSASNPPTMASGMLATILDVTGYPWFVNDPFVSTTHFWDADNGDDIKSDLEGTRDLLVGTKHFLFTIENAYQKIKKGNVRIFV